jgi:hypothetical protein
MKFCINQSFRQCFKQQKLLDSVENESERDIETRVTKVRERERAARRGRGRLG